MQTADKLRAEMPLSVQSRPTFGFTLSNEQFPAPYLVELGMAVERAGSMPFWCSDHFQPWQDNDGHSSAGLGDPGGCRPAPERVVMGTGVTCPTYRFHPSVVAHCSLRWACSIRAGFGWVWARVKQ